MFLLQKTFLGKIGGHSARENIQRILLAIFDDGLAKFSKGKEK